MWKKSILSQYNSQNKQSEMDISTSGASNGEGYDSPVFHVLLYFGSIRIYILTSGRLEVVPNETN